jgi:8-oxo-dGTP pyrophosphatase MutT (NUDIX family)
MSEVIRPIFATESEQNQKIRTGPPKDAATLVLVDGSGGTPRILMGRRKASLKFMPGLYVFPGGRVDPSDGRMAHVGALPPAGCDKLKARAGRLSTRRMRALALAAIRETYEETGVLLGVRAPPAAVPSEDWAAFATHGVTPDLSVLTFVCRAITPPGRPRRFDTRFFLADAGAAAVTLPPDERPDTDLEAVEWLTPTEARQKPLPFITGVILTDLETRLARADWADPSLPVPYYFTRGNSHLKDHI